VGGQVSMPYTRPYTSLGCTMNKTAFYELANSGAGIVK